MRDDEAYNLVKDILGRKDSYDFYSYSHQNHISNYERGRIDILKRFNINYEDAVREAIDELKPHHKLSYAWKHILEVLENELKTHLSENKSGVKE